MPGFATVTMLPHRAAAPDPRLSMWLRRMLWLGAVAVLLLPAARGHNAWLGWMPLWLLGMPLSALWALHGFRLPLRALQSTPVLRQRRRRGAQARRRVRRPLRQRPQRVA